MGWNRTDDCGFYGALAARARTFALATASVVTDRRTRLF